MIQQRIPGAQYLGQGECRFLVWVPRAEKVEVHLLGNNDRLVPLVAGEHGYHEQVIDGVAAGDRYLFRLDGQLERPDPASRFQPEGVHGPSQVCAAAFPWQDDSWSGLPLANLVLYELHVGTFTREGTLDAIIPNLDELKELGITAVNLMPLAQFTGSRNWGYDGVYLYAVQNSYGGPEALKRLVDACHQRGLAVILDVVYNHLGPEGNYLGDFGPYFTTTPTPWGPALNFDGPDSDEVRAFFLGNALTWQTEFHIDGLRLDAIHAIRDHSAYPFLQRLADVTRQQSAKLGRPFYLISESALNDTRVIRPAELGGFGHHAQWNDDFHHALHALLTGEKAGHYQDFGDLDHLVRAWREGFVLTGQHSRYRRRRHGHSSHAMPSHHFVVFSQNHDQAGNRPRGERLSRLVDFESLKLAAAAVLLSSYIPLLFMGEEYGETAPFPFFISHGDPDLADRVRKGRQRGFEHFGWQGQGDMLDPFAEATFHSAVLNHDLKHQGNHQILWEFYKEVIRLRKTMPALAQLSKDHQEVLGYKQEKVLFVRRWHEKNHVIMLFNFGQEPAVVQSSGGWKVLLSSCDVRWGGSDSISAEVLIGRLPVKPKAVVLLERTHGVSGG